VGLAPARALAALILGCGLLLAGATAAGAAPANLAPPSVHGTAQYAARLVAEPGTWSSTDAAYAYRWLRDGRPIAGATGPSYRPTLADLGRRLAVRVTATDPTGSATAVSAPTDPVARAELRNRRPPAVHGVARYTRTVTASPGRWSPAPARVRYQWLRNGRPITGATGRRYRFAPEDVGERVRVRVLATAPGHVPASKRSARPDPVGHRVDVRRRATYSVATRGRITTSLATFRRQAAETYADPRGWRGAGVAFRQVPRGGSFTLVLAEASVVPSFSSVCSAMWSCRVGRFVIINQDRWRHASPAWNAAGRSLRDYRHLVVNHETGHWLGHGHASCPGRGRPAPVMMQQSKGTGGCRFNPWPTLAELSRR
jgi:hypothetical protein